MQLEDLTQDGFEPNHLSDEDRVRWKFAAVAGAAGDTHLAERILSGEADDYSPMRLPLFFADHREHPPEFFAEWHQLTR